MSYLKMQWLKQKINQFLWVSNTGTDRFLGLFPSQKTPVKMLAGILVSSEVSTGEKSTSKFPPEVIAWIQFLKSCWSDDLSPTLAVG